MSLTREDMLRELELLPVWQLRQPLSQAAPLQEVAPETSPQIEAAVAAPAMQESAVQEVTHEVVTDLPASEPVTEEIMTESAWAELPEESEAPAAMAMPPDTQLPSAEVSLGQGRRESIMRLDWQGLQDCVSHCEACGLAKTRTQTVFGVGDPNADWLIVGEAPGAEEDKQGEPFVGQAGKLLDNMLAAIQLKRGENVYIANVLKCRPPQNRDPHGDEVVQCDPFLKRQVELIKPKLILALGKFAAQSLLGSEDTIASMRGKQHSFHGVPVIVTYHPAYLLRNLPDKAKAWDDLCTARELMQTLQIANAPSSI